MPQLLLITRTSRLGLLVILWVSLFAGCTQPAASVPTVMPTLAPTSTPGAIPVTSTPTSIPTPSLTPTATRGPTATPFAPVYQVTLKLKSKFMNGMERVVSVYLPGEYERFPQKRYKVLYAFDAQQLPEIAFEQYLNSLYMSNRIEPVIVVAVQTPDDDLRKEILGTGPYLNVFGWGTLSDVFNKFIVNELVPKIQDTYRVQKGSQNTAIMGWSLGGLASVYLAWQYPDQFGIVGAFSPSLWWRAESPAGGELQARVMHRVVRESSKRSGLRFWFEAGTSEEPKTDLDKNGTPDVIQDIQDLMKELEKKGYQPGTDMVYVQVAGGQHSITTWARVLPDFLQWAFPAAS